MYPSSRPLRATLPLVLAALGSLASAQSAGEAMYEVTFDATWSAGTHPHAYPALAHFSQPVGVAHDATVSFWEPGGLATEGIERMAESGSISPLTDEMDAAILAGAALEVALGSGIVSPSSTTFLLRVGADHPLATIVTMIAPSPDWFVGTHGLSLLDGNGRFVEELTVELPAYDSGTDSGTDFTSGNANTDPPDPITRITTATGGPFTGDDPLGTFTFRLLYSSQRYGCMNPANSLSVVSGEPRIGQTITLGLDDPTGRLMAPATTRLLGSTTPSAGFPCGLPVGGGHIRLAGRSELLLQAPILVRLSGAPWTGSPVLIDLPIPPTLALVGTRFYVQGAMFGDLSVVLTEGMELVIGN